MRSLRSRLLAWFVLLALGGVGLTALSGVLILRERALAQAHHSFAAAREQLRRSLHVRYQVFEAVSSLSVGLLAIREVTTYRDRSDFGFASGNDDRQRREDLHQVVTDGQWDWLTSALGGLFAIADYKGRLVYSSSVPSAGGGDLLSMPAVARAYDDRSQFRGAMLIRGDDPRARTTGLLDPEARGLYVLFGRSVLPDRPDAVLVGGIPAARLLEDVALAGGETHVAIVAEDGAYAGDIPELVRDRAMLLADDAPPVQLVFSDQGWLAQRSALLAPGTDERIGAVVVAANLSVGLALLMQASTALLIAATVLLAVAGVLALLLSRRLARPIVALEAAAHRIAGGDLGVRVEPGSGDELGRLAIAFNDMAEGLRERERIRHTFKKYLSPEVGDYLLAHPEAQQLGGKRERLTMMFSDLASFTTYSEGTEPEVVVALLNRYFAAVSARIQARGGTVDKYIGDAVMAFFGAPVPRADHAAQACLAALDHLAVFDAMQPEWRGRGWTGISVRIGLHTGEVVVGNIGGEHGQDYTVIGDAVNLASRLEGVNRFYGTRILITESVRTEAGAAVVAQEIDRVRVKGKSEPVRIYELLGAAGFAPPPEVERFASGLAAYRAGRFDEAAELFASGGYGPAATFLARARVYAAQPPPEAWDGVFDLESK